MEIIQIFINKISLHEINILFLLGLAIFGGTIGGRIFQKIKIPQVVGYIIIGIILGETGFKIINLKILNNLQPINYFALGLISFTLGGELKLSIFKKFGKQFTYILFFEALGSFFFVSIFFLIFGAFFLPLKIIIVLSLLLGSISAATAAAGTTDVLWEYKTRGVLTTTVLGIVALDDVLALFLFAICSSIAAAFLSKGHTNLLLNIIKPIYEIGVASIIGIVSGIILAKLLKKHTEEEHIFVFSIGLIVFILGLSLIIKVDMLMAATIMGVTFSNIALKKSEVIFKLIKKFAPPVYVLFFVFVGAKIQIQNLSFMLLIFILIFIFGRTAGKTIGTVLGSKISKAPEKLRKYLPFCLFSQSGVAIGLSIIASQRFPGIIGETILIIIATTTFIVQIIGPPLIKMAVSKANEVGLNITEEDLIKKTKVFEVMDKKVPLLLEEMKLSKILNLFSEYNNSYFPVVNNKKRLVGVVGFENIKNSFSLPHLNNIILAADIMTPLSVHVNQNTPLADAIGIMNKIGIEFLPIENDKNKVIGILESQVIKKLITKKLFILQQKAEI